MRRFASGRIKADKRKSRLVTAQVLRPLDMPSGVAKREKFAVKGLQRHQPLAEAVAEACAIAGRSGRVWGGAPVNTSTPLPGAHDEKTLPIYGLCDFKKRSGYYGYWANMGKV